ncbi:MAG: class I SAM-dependent methyltransferase [Acidimicrobiales bacterium]
MDTKLSARRGRASPAAGPMVARSRAEPNRFATELFAGLPSRYDVLAAVLSLGQDRRWRAATVERTLAGPTSKVLDVATGPAGVALAVEARTGAMVVGVDVTEAMLRQGRQNVVRRGRQDRIQLLVGRGEELPFRDATFDALTFTYLLRYVADPAGTLAELARVVRPGGTIASLEFHLPPLPVWRPLWWMYTRAVLPAAGGLLGGREWYDVGRFLGPSITAHYRRHPVPRTMAAWREAGIDGVGARTMSLGGGLVMWGTRAGGQPRLSPAPAGAEAVDA